VPEVDFIETQFDKKAQTMGIRKREFFANFVLSAWVLVWTGVMIYGLI
jgi:hypothetical protein